MNQYSSYSDQDLFSAIQSNDSMAFKQLYLRYWTPLVNHAVKMLPTTLYAEEVVQDLFVKIWQTRDSFQIENISNYLYSGVRHGCISLHRVLLHKKKYWEHYKLSIPSGESVEDEYIKNEKYLELDKAISGLPKNAQKIVRMKIVEGLTLQEISKKLNCSKKTVVYHFYKSMESLKTEFHLKALLILSYLLSLYK